MNATQLYKLADELEQSGADLWARFYAECKTYHALEGPLLVL